MTEPAATSITTPDLIAAPPVSAASNFGKWMALIAALLGWLFDGLEMGLFPLVQRSALSELLGSASEQDISLWRGVITSFFLIGAATGGVLFGWLGDRIGRVRSMMLSVLTYALVSALCGFASTPWEVGIYRFIAALGMGGEWSLGVALICEIWPNRSRAFLAGLIGAAANVGYLLIALVGLGVLQQVGQLRSSFLAVGLPEGWVEQLFRNDGWRFLMMLGAAPALLTFVIRLFVPESAKWQEEQKKGGTSHWATRDLLAVLVGAIAACGIIALWAIPVPTDDPTQRALFWGARLAGTLVGLAFVTYAYIYPARRYLERAAASFGGGDGALSGTLSRMLVAACLSAVALLGTWGSVQQAPAWADSLAVAQLKEQYPDPATRPPKPPVNAYTQIAASLGAIVGTIVAALLGGWLGRRVTYCLLCLGSMIIIPIFFHTSADPNGLLFWALAFLAGGITASFYGWLPLYLPELFRTAVRATGQGFGFNFGRVIAAIGVLQLGPLQQLLGGTPAVATALSLMYVLGLVLIWFVPETKGQPLPE
jgi:MFS transporter, SHS family, sialic acid transporter